MTAGRILSGTAASDGIAIGPEHLRVQPVVVVEREITRDLVPSEVARLIAAVASTDEQLALLSVGLEAGHLHEGHLLLEAHRMMLRDDEIVGGTRRLIESEEIAAEGAVRRVIDAIAAKFGRMEDPYLRERRADIEAIGDRLLRTLLGLPEVSTDTSLAPGTIGVGSILSPIDALHLPRSGMVGFAAEAVGLFRTEFLYLDRPELPSEEEQFQDAVAVLAALGGRPATFRTLDIGGEKLPLAAAMPRGANPSLGVRAIRFSFLRPDIFRTQLRALYRASAVGPLRIMFPLVSGISELDEAQRLCAETAEELAREGVAFDRNLPIGVMIETPSAALSTDHLAKSSSFFSIGTNDLIQYTFAADRENEDVAHLYHPLHPAVLRLLKSAIDGANGAGKPIAICGDMAGDPAFTWVLLGLGLRSLSMSPRLIPAVKSIISASRLDEMETLVAQALTLRTETAVEDLVLGVMRERFPLELASADSRPISCS